MGSKPSKTLWWVHGDGGPLMPLDSLAEGSMADHVVLEEWRPAEPRGLHRHPRARHAERARSAGGERPTTCEVRRGPRKDVGRVE